MDEAPQVRTPHRKHRPACPLRSPLLVLHVHSAAAAQAHVRSSRLPQVSVELLSQPSGEGLPDNIDYDQIGDQGIWDAIADEAAIFEDLSFEGEPIPDPVSPDGSAATDEEQPADEQPADEQQGASEEQVGCCWCMHAAK